MKAADWLYDRLPEKWKDIVYNNAVNDALNGIDKASWFRKSEWHADAMGTANQLKDASNLAENRYRDLHNIEKQLEAIPKEPFGQDAKQIMTRGFLAHEAGRLGKLSDSLISALQEQTGHASSGSQIRLVEPEKHRMEGQIEQIERKLPKQEMGWEVEAINTDLDRKEQQLEDNGRGRFDEEAVLPEGYSLMRFPNGDRQILTNDGEIIDLAPGADPWSVSVEYESEHQTNGSDAGNDEPDYAAKMQAMDWDHILEEAEAEEWHDQEHQDYERDRRVTEHRERDDDEEELGL